MPLTENSKIAKLPEILKTLTLNLPVRRSQVTNWGSRLLGINKPFCGKFKGLPIEVHPLEPASRSAYFLGFYERETTAWAIEYFRREQPKLIIDVGAHFGYFIYLAYGELSGSTIYAFEPDPANLTWLKRNTSMLDTSNTIHIVEKAVSDKNGKVKFMSSDPEKHNNLWAGISLDSKSTSYDIDVDSITLDSYCKLKNINEVNLVIMDIEGGEGPAVEGMLEGIKTHTYKNVLLEFHPELLKGIYSPDKIVRKFTDNGYKAFHFQTPYGYDVRNDKIFGFYDLSWKDHYLKEVDPSNVQLKGWEHILFKI